MASGDVVYDKSNMLVSSMSVQHFGSNGWSAALNVGGTSSPHDDVSISVIVSSPVGAPFDVTKTYDVIIKEH